MSDKPLVFFDIETTGLSPDQHEVIEFAGLKVFSDNTVDFLELRILPDHIETASPRALEVAGYSEEAWEIDAVPKSEALPQVYQFMCGGVAVGYNSERFDKPFLEAELKRADVGRLPYRSKDVYLLARERLAGKLDFFKLTDVCEFFGISNADAHSAMSDVIRTKEVYDRLMALEDF